MHCGLVCTMHGKYRTKCMVIMKVDLSLASPLGHSRWMCKVSMALPNIINVGLFIENIFILKNTSHSHCKFHTCIVA